jgi:hypothetical protein
MVISDNIGRITLAMKVTIAQKNRSYRRSIRRSTKSPDIVLYAFDHLYF